MQEDDEKIKKPNEAIGMRVSKGHLSFISRKLFNVMVLRAQQVGAPGVNAPIDSETAASYFWVPASDIQRDANYNSNDTKLLKETLDELQDIKIVSEDDIAWTSERMLASVKIVNPAGLNKRGGKLWVGYQFPAEVLHLVMNPRSYTMLSLYYMTVLRTNAGLALYEAAKKHAWKSPEALTHRESWEKWRDYLEGMSGKDMPEWKHQYKFFKDRVLKKAIAEVNSLTDIEVELIEHKDGKRVIDLQFRVTKRPQGTLDLPAPPVIDSEVIERLMRLGINKQEAGAIFSTNGDNDIRTALDYTEERIRNTKLPPLDSPAGYFKNALRGKYVTLAKPVKQSTPEPKKKQEMSEDPTFKARVESELAAFDAMTDEDKDSVWNSFIESTGARTIKRTGAIGRKMLGAWLAKQ